MKNKNYVPNSQGFELDQFSIRDNLSEKNEFTEHVIYLGSLCRELIKEKNELKTALEQLAIEFHANEEKLNQIMTSNTWIISKKITKFLKIFKAIWRRISRLFE